MTRMMTISTQFDEAIPEWDIALEALIREEQQKLGRPLVLGDFQRLCLKFVIRFDDMMETLFELVIRGKWAYYDEQGAPVTITREQFERLRCNGRIEVGDVRHFTGGWRALA
jgi:hypothetical protein